MKPKKHTIAAATMLLALSLGSSAIAGPYADDLSKCLVAKTTEADRVAFVQWMFFAASLHPAVRPIASISPEQLDAANKRTATMFMKLLTESCRQESSTVIKYEGLAAFQSSFQVLGQIAGNELFASPEVAAGMAGLEKYFDREKLQSLTSKTP